MLIFGRYCVGFRKTSIIPTIRQKIIVNIFQRSKKGYFAVKSPIQLLIRLRQIQILQQIKYSNQSWVQIRIRIKQMQMQLIKQIKLVLNRLRSQLQCKYTRIRIN